MIRWIPVALLAVLSFILAGPAESPRSATRAAASRPAKLDRPALERELQEMLADVALEGWWRQADEQAESGWSELRAERYEISGVSKAGGDVWIVHARIQYATKDVTLPVPVRVVWAGDTPVLTLNDLNLPGLGTCSARIMLHGGFYAGTWFAAGLRGVLSGRIVKKANQPDPKAERSPTTRPARDSAD